MLRVLLAVTVAAIVCGPVLYAGLTGFARAVEAYDRWRDTMTHRLSLYLEPRDAWVGVYVGPDAIYVCPLPFVVIRWRRARPHISRLMDNAIRARATTPDPPFAYGPGAAAALTAPRHSTPDPDALVLHRGDDGATRLGFDFGTAGRVAVALDFTQAAQLATAMTRGS